MIAIDTDVLAVYHVFHNDPRYMATKAFLDATKDQMRAVTVFNLLELCGIFAAANRPKESKAVLEGYLKAENALVVFPDLVAYDPGNFWLATVSECFSRIQRGMRFGDAAILWTLETNNNIDVFVTWNTKHFADKTPIRIMTPAEFPKPTL